LTKAQVAEKPKLSEQEVNATFSCCRKLRLMLSLLQLLLLKRKLLKLKLKKLLQKNNVSITTFFVNGIAGPPNT
jgi:hypothetical protein